MRLIDKTPQVDRRSFLASTGAAALVVTGGAVMCPSESWALEAKNLKPEIGAHAHQNGARCLPARSASRQVLRRLRQGPGRQGRGGLAPEQDPRGRRCQARCRRQSRPRRRLRRRLLGARARRSAEASPRPKAFSAPSKATSSSRSTTTRMSGRTSVTRAKAPPRAATSSAASTISIGSDIRHD